MKAVSVFIIISGFVITHLLMVKHEPYPRYIKRRAFRIFPIYLVCIALAILLTPAQALVHGAPWVPHGEFWVAGFEDQFKHFAAHIFLHATLLHGIVPDTVLPYSAWAFLGPAWSLSLEWQFYLLAPFFIFLLLKSIVSRVVTIAVFAGLFFVSTHGYLGEWRFPSMLFLSIHLFLIGILSRIYFEKILSKPVWATIFVGLLSAYFLRSIRLELCIWTFAMLAMRYESIKIDNVFVKSIRFIATNKLAAEMGKASYSTYLVHILLLSLLASIGNYLVSGYTINIARIAALVTITLLPTVSLFLYNYVERPFMRFGIGPTQARPIKQAPRAKVKSGVQPF